MISVEQYIDVTSYHHILYINHDVSLLFTLQEALNQRLDSRVDSMVKDGLLAEIRSFYDAYVTNRWEMKILFLKQQSLCPKFGLDFTELIGRSFKSVFDHDVAKFNNFFLLIIFVIYIKKQHSSTH